MPFNMDVSFKNTEQLDQPSSWEGIKNCDNHK